jgi:3-hydroxyisobutyrate dehydrogenase-like beta-hydroxyacid dehydrogenase
MIEGMVRIGLLHPGQMGFAVGCTLKNSGHDVLWASEGRSPHTVNRASTAGFEDTGTLDKLAQSASVIVSVCPPEFARDVAQRVAWTGFSGLYADVNAVSPDSKVEIARVMETSGASFADGGIIGLPSKERGRTWLYLSGPHASEIASLFTAGPMEVEVLGGEPGKASALKMCYAAWSKGSTALVAAVLAAADEMLVLEELKTAWSRGGPVYSKVEADVLRAAPKAWRYAGEMREIAATLEAAGLPGGFHHAAEDLYNRLKALKDLSGIQMAEVLAHLKTRNT